MANDISGISDAIQKSAEAFAKAISAVSEALQGASNLSAGSDRDRLLENWMRVARLSKDGVITALEQGFKTWERQVRQLTGQDSKAEAPANPLQAWAENWRSAIDAFTGSGNASDEARRQAEAFQKTFADSVRAWQRVWLPDRK
jgi:hypothetical protein